MTAITIAVTAFGILLALCAWWGCHWLARRLDRDDDKDKGVFHD